MGKFKQTKYGTQGIEGFDKVLKNLQTEITRIEGATLGGILAAVAEVRTDMDTTPPLIPVDTGNLRASWTVKPVQLHKVKGAIFGFFANYALWVHEMVGADFTSTRTRYGPGKGKKREYTPREGAGAKFFETALIRNAPRILEIIRNRAKIKK